MKYRSTTIGEIADIQTGPFGSQLHNKDYILVGTPIVTVEHLGGCKMTRQNLPCVTDVDKARLSKYILKRGDTVFSRVGSVDRCSLVSDDEDGWLFSGRCLRVRSMDPDVDSNYLYYFFNAENTKDTIRNLAVGSTMPSLNTSVLSGVPIDLPPLPVQQEIGWSLSALDAKIAANTAVNHNLEQTARAVFAELCNDGNTAKLSDILTVCYGKDHKWLADGDVPCYGSGGIMRYVDTAIYNGESVLIPRKGSLNNVMYVNMPFWTVDTMFYTQMTQANVAKFAYFTVRDLDLAGMNVGSAVPSMTTAILNELEILLPPKEVLSQFEEAVSPMFQQMQVNSADSVRLAELRDSLLPKLMSGELAIGDG
jgi:type I restriction enzyme S subunit